MAARAALDHRLSAHNEKHGADQACQGGSDHRGGVEPNPTVHRNGVQREVARPRPGGKQPRLVWRRQKPRLTQPGVPLQVVVMVSQVEYSVQVQLLET